MGKIIMYGRSIADIDKTLDLAFDRYCKVVNFSAWIREEIFNDFELIMRDSEDIDKLDLAVSKYFYKDKAEWLREKMRNKIKENYIIETQKIKVYDIESWAKEKWNNKKLFGKQKLAIISCPDGDILIDSKAEYEVIGDLGEIQLEFIDSTPEKDGEFIRLKSAPQYAINVKLEEILALEYKEMNLRDFIEKPVADEIENNYISLMDCIDENGLDYREFGSKKDMRLHGI